MRLVALEHVPAAHGAKDAHDGKEHAHGLAQPWLALVGHPLAKVVHGTAGDRPVGIFITILDRQGTFGKLGSHAEQARR